jgi:23S rRNA (pseudouridine1915-N3)-methyltransferase
MNIIARRSARFDLFARLPFASRGFNSTPSLRAFKVALHIRGHARGGDDAWLGDAYDSYAERLRARGLSLDTIWHKTDKQLAAAALQNTPKIPTLCLDENGKSMDSVAFSALLHQLLEQGGSRLTIVIGGAEGLPPELRPGIQQGAKHSTQHISLSKLTFTHQMARVLLAEQVYRAVEIKRGSAYHKT